MHAFYLLYQTRDHWLHLKIITVFMYLGFPQKIQGVLFYSVETHSHSIGAKLMVCQTTFFKEIS